MMKIDQGNLKILYIKKGQSEAELEQFILKNRAILSFRLLVFEELSENLRNYLDSQNIDYIVPKSLKVKQNAPLNLNLESESESKPPDSKNLESNLESSAPKTESKDDLKTKIIDRVVRSGEVIKHSGDIIVFNRANSASKIQSERNICVFGECEGDIECSGDYMILSRAHKGKVRFCGENITTTMLKYSLNLIKKEKNSIKIMDFFEIIGVKK